MLYYSIVLSLFPPTLIVNIQFDYKYYLITAKNEYNPLISFLE